MVVACHSIGFATACLTCGRIIRRVGHIRVFAAFAATLAFCCLCFPIAVNPAAWIVLRLVFGYSGAACFMVGESWLAGAAPRDMKGKVFAIYMVINKASFGLGQLFLMVGDPSGDRLFMLAAALYALCLVPIALTRAQGPDALGRERLSFAALYRLSPVGVMGAVSAGFTNASLVGLGPVFATRQGLDVTQVSLFMVAFLAGNLVLQLPIGRTSDRFDRRSVLFVVAVLTTGACIAMAMVPNPGFPGLACPVRAGRRRQRHDLSHRHDARDRPRAAAADRVAARRHAAGLLDGGEHRAGAGVAGDAGDRRRRALCLRGRR